MRISELSDATDVSVPTIKYYLREGLLPAGEKVGERRSEYGDRHVRRLHLLRVLREIGGVPVERLRLLVEAVEDPRLSVHRMFGAACDAIGPQVGEPGPGRAEARAIADLIVDDAGWDRVREDAPAREELAEVLEALAAHGMGGEGEVAAAYVEVADRLAREEMAHVRGDDRAEKLEWMVLGSVLGGRVLLTLRRLAEEHHSALRFSDQ